MGEKLSAIVSDLEASRQYEKLIVGSLKESGLSFRAEVVVSKLKDADVSEGWHRAYKKLGNEITLVDALADREIAWKGYKPADDEPLTISGTSPARRDVLRKHATPDPLYEDLWIGETLE